MKSSKPPKPPTFMPPPAFTPPPQPVVPSFVKPPDHSTLQAMIPQVYDANQVMTVGAQAESKLPQWLQFSDQNPLDPAGRSAHEDYFYQTQIAPLIAQQQAQLFENGQNRGSYAGGLIGQLSAQGALSKYQAGLDYANSLFQNQLQGRTSYLSGGPTIAANQNAADVDRGFNMAQLLQRNSEMENNFNLGSAGMQNDYGLQSVGMQNNYGLSSTGMANNFSLSNYGNALNAYQINEANKAARFGALGGGLTSMVGGLLGMKRPSFGGGYAGGAVPRPDVLSAGGTLGSNFGMSGTLGGLGRNTVGSFGGFGSFA